jgi:hypothetical protein
MVRERLADTGQNPYIDLALILSCYFGRAVHKDISVVVGARAEMEDVVEAAL